MKKELLGFGAFVGCIAGIVIIKLLNLPWYLNIILILALFMGFIVLFSKVMVCDEKKDLTTEGNSSLEKT
jgi:uncharacterized membrane protein YfcA